MAFSRAFERELNSLFRQRTDWLRRKLGARGAGKPPKFGRKKVNAGIDRLRGIASDALAHKLAKAEFNEQVGARKNYHVKGRGPGDKKKKFEKWFASRFQNRRGLIYAFWGNHKKCGVLDRAACRAPADAGRLGKDAAGGGRETVKMAYSGL